MGEVYEALHVDLNKRVAVKTLLPAIASRPEIIARFLREGQATARLRHPHAVDVFDVGVDQGVPFLVMEFLDGETLEALIEREAPLAPSRIAEIMLPVIAAVKAAHDEGIVHRDLKPANIFLHRSRDQRVIPKVLDFGISKMADEDGAPALTHTSSLLGTPNYMSPEQLRSSKHVDARTDQYALGTILYECATRRRPFHGETIYVLMSAIASGQFVPPMAIVPSIPPLFDQTIRRAMSLDPAQRFDSLTLLGVALVGFADVRTASVWDGVFDSRGSLAPTWTPRPSLPPGQFLGPPTPMPGTLEGRSLDVSQRLSAAPSRSRTGWAVVGALLGVGLLAGGMALLAQGGSSRDAAATVRAATSPSDPRAVATPPLQPTVTPVTAPSLNRPAAPVEPASPQVVPVVRAAPLAPVATPTEPAVVMARGRHDGRRRRRDVRDRSPGAPIDFPQNSPQGSGTNAIPIVQ